jgi:hypothetical protein
MNTKDLTRREIDKQSFPLPLLKSLSRFFGKRGAESPIIGVSDGVRCNSFITQNPKLITQNS